MCGTIRSVEDKNRHLKWELCSCTGFLGWCKYGTTSILACFLHSHGLNVEFSSKIFPNELFSQVYLVKTLLVAEKGCTLKVTTSITSADGI